MSQRFDESQLIELIEGELDSAAAASLRGRVADDPKTLAMLAKLENDRHVLRSLPEPEPPPQLQSQIENILARPMLIEAVKPGVYRRQQRRIARQRRLRRLATAAMIALSISGAVWAAANFLLPMVVKQLNRQSIASNDSKQTLPTDSSDRAVAKNPVQAAPPSSAIGANELATIAKSDDTVHHYLPQPVTMDKFLADIAVPRRNRPETTATQIAPAEQIVAEFAVVIQSSDPAASEKSLAGMVTDLGRYSALVRNFSYAEARRLETEWRIAEANRRNNSDGAPAVAQADKTPAKPASNHPMSGLAHRVRQAVPADVRKSADLSGQVAGAAEVAPSLEEQLDFSSRGATHTVSVPAKQLDSMLERLGQISNQSTSLRMLPSATAESQPASATAPSLSSWLEDGPRVRASIAKLIHDHPGAEVLVPVIVVEQKSK